MPKLVKNRQRIQRLDTEAMTDSHTCNRKNERYIDLNTKIWRRHTLRQNNVGYTRKNV